jgi:hypothetical protein
VSSVLKTFINDWYTAGSWGSIPKTIGEGVIGHVGLECVLTSLMGRKEAAYTCVPLVYSW